MPLGHHMARLRHACRSGGALLLIPALLLCAGCSIPVGGSLTTIGLGNNPVKLESQFETGYFAIEPAQTTVIFSSIPYVTMADGHTADGQFLHIEVLWHPKAGSTAIEPTSTNLSIRLVVVSKGEVGIYGGGGFGWIDGGTAEDAQLGIDITGSSLSLLESTPGFVDLLSPATMLGHVGAVQDAQRARAYRRAASQMVTNKLGRVQWVRR